MNRSRIIDMSLLLFYVGLRSYKLLKFPVFIDEAFHIWWAKETLKLHPFGGIGEGKTLIAWVIAPFWPFENGLWAGRIPIVLIGAIGLSAIIAIGRSIGGNRVGWLAAGVYLIIPYAAFFERMALADPLGASCAIIALWVVYRAFKSNHHKRLLSVIAGGLIGLTILAKLPLIVLTALPIAGWILLARDRKPRLKSLIAMYLGIAFVLLPVLALSQFAGSFGFSHAQNNFTDLRLATLPQRVRVNAAEYISWSKAYLGWVILLGGWLGLLVSIIQRKKTIIFFSLLLVLPVAEFFTTLVYGYPRYYLLTTGIHLILFAHLFWLIVETAKKGPIDRYVPINVTRILAVIAFLLIVLPMLQFTVRTFNAPATLPLPPRDFNDYITDESSGYGLDEAVSWLYAQDTNSVTIICQFRITCERLNVLTGSNNYVTYQRTDILTPAWVNKQIQSGNLVLLAQDEPSGVELYQAGPEYTLVPAGEFYRPGEQTGFNFYSIQVAP